MRRSKIITINKGQEVTVREITPLMVIDLLKMDASEGEQESWSMEAFDSLCREGCGLSCKELAGLYGSEIEAVWEAFKEVNTFFFKTAALLGLDKLPERVGLTITGIFSSELAGLLSSATSKQPTTAGNSSP